MVAQSVIEVIMGEAGGKTAAERYADMVAIASVIQNRAAQTGKTPDSIISAKGQFDAYGKALTPGVDSMRDLAQAAWDYVQEQGPVHNATFFATPDAAEGLPEGLKSETDTASHKYYSDPKGRSIRTAEGFVQPAKPDTQQVASPDLQRSQNPYADLVPERSVATTPIDAAALPGAAPVPTARPDNVAAGRTITPGIGLENLVSNSRGTPISSYDTSALDPSAQGLVETLGRAGFGNVGVNSGYRSPERNQRAGGANRSQHLSGRAIDLATAQMPEAQRAGLLEAGIVKGNAKGIGLYPSGNIHMDTRTTPTVWGPGRNAYAGVGIDQVPAYAQPIIGDMLNAGPYGVTPRTAPPTPTARPDNSSLAAPAGVVERASLPSVDDIARAEAYSEYGASRRAAPSEPVSPSRPDNTAFGGPRGSFSVGGNRASLPGSAPVPSARPSLDPVTVQSVPTPTPAPRSVNPMAPPAIDTMTPAQAATIAGASRQMPVPDFAGIDPRSMAAPMADNTPVTPGFPSAPGFPEAPRNPTSQRNREMAVGGLGGAVKGGIPGMVAGAIAGPAISQIRGNIRSNRMAPPGERQSILNGVRQAYNPMAGLDGSGLFGNFGGLLSEPDFNATPYSVGSGYDAIGGVFNAPAGARAVSRSDPNISWQSLGNGLAVRSNDKFGTSRIEGPDAYSMAGRGRSMGMGRAPGPGFGLGGLFGLGAGMNSGPSGGGGLFGGGGFFSGLFGGGNRSGSGRSGSSGKSSSRK